MKKIALLLLVGVILTGCTMTKHLDSTSTFYGIDFRKYVEEDFLITPEKYIGEYDGISIVSYIITPELNYVDINPQDFEVPKWYVEYIDIQQAVDSLYTFCIEWGANAIINFEAIEHPVQVPMPSGVMKEMDVGIKLSGFAIKRK